MSQELKPDTDGFRYILMWMNYHIENKLDADQSYLIEWADFVRDARDEIERLQAERDGLEGVNKILQVKHERLQAENAELKRDAERYRWLREQHWNEADMAVVCYPKKSVKLGFDCPSLDRLDAAIDAARAISSAAVE